MKNKEIVFAAFSIFCLMLSACDSDNDSIRNDGPANSCTTNIAGCEADTFSCSAAEFCYATVQGCQQSLECAIGSQSSDSCRTNVAGCEAEAFSCDAALSCYNTSAECVQSNECPIQ